MTSNQAYSGDGGGGISNAQAAANREIEEAVKWLE